MGMGIIAATPEAMRYPSAGATTGAASVSDDAVGEVMRLGSSNGTAPLALVRVLRRLLLVVFSSTLVVGVWVSTPRRIYDERFHLERADQIELGRPLSDVFTEPTPSAVGPVFPLVHAVVQRISGGSTRASRFVNIVAMVLCMGLVALVLRSTGD